MPTGYTAPIIDGDGVSFEDFVLGCARGMGALVMLRDSDQSLEATKRSISEQTYAEGSSYYEERLAEVRDCLTKIEAMADDEAYSAALAERNEVRRANEEHEAAANRKRARYEAMLEKVRAWEPPTDDHIAFKDFMVEQIEGSIEFDCGHFKREDPRLTTGADWRERQIARLKEQIVRDEERVQEEHERTEKRIAWVSAMVDSLGLETVG